VALHRLCCSALQWHFTGSAAVRYSGTTQALVQWVSFARYWEDFPLDRNTTGWPHPL